MKFVGSIRLKDELTLDDLLKIGSIGEALMKPPSGKYRRWRFNVICWNGMVRITTHVKYVFFWHRRKLNDIIEAHGVQKKADQIQNKRPYKESLNDIITLFCAELNQVPKQVAEGTTIEHVQPLYSKIMKKKIESWTMAAIGHHDPKQLKEHTDKIRRSLKMSERRQIDSGVKPEPSQPSSMLRVLAMQ